MTLLHACNSQGLCFPQVFYPLTQSAVLGDIEPFWMESSSEP